MAPAYSPYSLATLRAVSYRITSTPAEQLPVLASQLSGSIWNCKDILSTPADALKANAEVSTLVHRYKTTLSSLLQHRTIEGRWAAVVLTKATIEAGGIETLSKSNGWVRSLLSILKKPEPSTTRSLVIITLVRIFTLTWDYSNLVREITTPSLPGFITACILNVSRRRCSDGELETILNAFVKLLPRHPTVFRTHEAQIRDLIIGLLSEGGTTKGPSTTCSTSTRQAAQRLLALLHHCAPKQGGIEQWDNAFQNSVKAVHVTCDRLFRSVVEDWRSSAGIEQSFGASMMSSTEPELEIVDAAGLPPWHGILEGRERLLTLLESSQSYLKTTTAGAVPVRIGMLLDLLARLLGLTVPRSLDTVKANPQISKDEREMLFVLLPSIHASALKLIQILIDRFGQVASSIILTLLELILEVFRSENVNIEVRQTSYSCVEKILQILGPGLPKENTVELTPILRACCEDLLPIPSTHVSSNDSTVSTNGTFNDLAMKPDKQISPLAKISRDRSLPSMNLLATTISKVNPAYMPRKLRTQIERTAVISGNKEIMLACVLTPARKEAGGKLQTSLLPLLAKQFPDAIEVETLTRPRMPPIVGQSNDSPDDDPEDDYGYEQDLQSPRANPIHDGAVMNDEVTLDETTVGAGPDLQTSQPHNGISPEDDLYDVTPPRRVEPSAEEIQESLGAAKRPADDLDHQTVSAKRLRASPIAGALVGGLPSALPDPDRGTAASEIPVTVEQNPDKHATSGQTMTVVQPDQIAPAPSAGFETNTAEEHAGSDDSDFELPPLTMEPDTDPEGEEDESD